jgi:hypothetical protein
MQTSDSYLRVQATISALINMVVNPLITWLLNRGMQPVTLPAILIDMSITCLVMATAIAFFVSPGARRAVTAGGLEIDHRARSARLLERFPVRPVMLGITLGAACATLLVPLTWLVAVQLGWSGLAFWDLILMKILYTGTMAFLVTRWVILSQWQALRRRPTSHCERK